MEGKRAIMMKMLKKTMFFVLFFALQGCAYWNGNRIVEEISYPHDLSNVRKMADEQKWKEAHDSINSYLNKAENIRWYGHAYFLRGFLYESQQQDEKAVAAYRMAVQHSTGFDTKVQTQALYNLSFVYEKKRDFNSLATTLADLQKNKSLLPPLIARVETPARQAAVLFNQGDWKTALKIHHQALQSFKEINRQGRIQWREDAAGQAVFYLGLVVLNDEIKDLQTWFAAMAQGQNSLLINSESATDLWAIRSAETLDRLYRQTFQAIEHYDPRNLLSDPVAHQKRKQEYQLEAAAKLNDLSLQLLAEAQPNTTTTDAASHVHKTARDWNLKLQKWVLSLDLGPHTERSKKVKLPTLPVFSQKKKTTTPVKEVIHKEQPPIEAEFERKASQKPDIGEDPNL